MYSITKKINTMEKFNQGRKVTIIHGNKMLHGEIVCKHPYTNGGSYYEIELDTPIRGIQTIIVDIDTITY